MKSKRIRRNDRVWFDDGCIRQGLVEDTEDGLMHIRLDGFGGKVLQIARRKNGKWYTFRTHDDYNVKVFKI